jgi:hypothetical protein
MRPVRLLKIFLRLALTAFTLAANAQSEWPRNSQTNKIEFAGTLPWPSNARTDKQRRALVRNWYQKRLASASLSDSTGAYLSSELMWNLHRPSHVRITCQEGQRGGSHYCILTYDVQLNPSATGLVYHLFNFYWGWPMEDMESYGSLESVLPYLHSYSPQEQEALRVLRNQLTNAFTGWHQ